MWPNLQDLKWKIGLSCWGSWHRSRGCALKCSLLHTMLDLQPADCSTFQDSPHPVYILLDAHSAFVYKAK